MEKTLLITLSTSKSDEIEQLALEVIFSELPTDMCVGPVTNPITMSLSNKTSTIDHISKSEHCTASSLTQNQHSQNLKAQSTGIFGKNV